MLSISVFTFCTTDDFQINAGIAEKVTYVRKMYLIKILKQGIHLEKKAD